MSNLALIFANLGRFAAASPLRCSSRNSEVLVVDRRQPLPEVIDAIRESLACGNVDHTELLVADSVELDCDAGAHDWRQIIDGGVSVGARCQRCPVTYDWSDQPLPVFERLAAD